MEERRNKSIGYRRTLYGYDLILNRYIVAKYKCDLDSNGKIENFWDKFVNLPAEIQIRVGENLRKLYDIMQTK